MFDSYPRIHHLYREQLVPRPIDEVFGFFARAGNLERITPPWLGFSLQDPEPAEMRAGTLIEYRLHLHRLPLRWISRIGLWEPGRAFEDVQIKGSAPPEAARWYRITSATRCRSGRLASSRMPRSWSATWRGSSRSATPR
jgi:ligand-binding SRPBCC domain-containing protein